MMNIYRDQDITYFNDDCTSVLKDMNKESVDVIITDPPYGVYYQSNHRTATEKLPRIAGDEEVPVNWIDDAFRVLKDPGCIFCFCRWDTEYQFGLALKNAGFIIKSQVIWDRVVHGMGDLEGQYGPQHDNALFAVKGRYKFPGARPLSIYRYSRVNPDKLVHPNEKPLSLMARIVMDLTEKDQMILDPFMGSGTTGIACRRLGRRFIGCEISKMYFDVAVNKMKREQEQPSLFYGYSEDDDTEI